VLPHETLELRRQISNLPTRQSELGVALALFLSFRSTPSRATSPKSTDDERQKLTYFAILTSEIAHVKRVAADALGLCTTPKAVKYHALIRITPAVKRRGPKVCLDRKEHEPCGPWSLAEADNLGLGGLLPLPEPYQLVASFEVLMRMTRAEPPQTLHMLDNVFCQRGEPHPMEKATADARRRVSRVLASGQHKMLYFQCVDSVDNCPDPGHQALAFGVTIEPRSASPACSTLLSAPPIAHGIQAAAMLNF
jgi:hypothetical protein